MEIAVKCLHCGAANYIEEGREKIFCSACGKENQIKYTGDVHVVELWERMFRDAEACMEIEEYEKAEKILVQAMKDKPGEICLYEPLVRAITNGYTDFQSYKKNRAMEIAGRVFSLVPDEDKVDCGQWKDSVEEAFDNWKKMEDYKVWYEKKEAVGNKLGTAFAFAIVFLILLLLSLFVYKDPVVVEIMTMMSVGGLCLCVLAMLVFVIQIIKPLHKSRKLEAEVLALMKMWEQADEQV